MSYVINFNRISIYGVRNRMYFCYVLLVVSLVVLPFVDTSRAVAQEGGRSAEADVGTRESAEREGRRSPEAEAGRRRSAEADAGERKSAEGDRGRADGREGSRLRDFKPQTEREAALYRMILQLQREVAALRNEVRSSSRGERSGGERGARDEASSRERGAVRDGDVAATGYEQFKLPDNWKNMKEGRVFKAYDKNNDEIVSLDEWLAMTNGNISDARRAISTKHFNDAEPSGDGEFTPAEFIWWRQIGSRQAAARAREGRTRDGVEKRGPRDGDDRGDRSRDGRSSRDGDRG